LIATIPGGDETTGITDMRFTDTFFEVDRCADATGSCAQTETTRYTWNGTALVRAGTHRQWQ